MTARGRLGLASALIGVVLVVVAVVLLMNQPKPVKPPSARVLPIVTPAFPTPGTQATSGYRVVSSDLKIDLPIVPGDGWTVPLYRAAAYPGMPLPGQGGRSFIYAHAQTGMFGPLLHASVGQRVDIVTPKGTTLHYVIRQYFPKWPPGDTRYLQPADHDELVLLTCTTYNANDPRILAVAEPT